MRISVRLKKKKNLSILGSKNKGKIRKERLRSLEVSGRQLCWYQFVILQLFGVDALGVVDGSINFTDAHTLGPKPVQVPHGVKTHITKSLWRNNTKVIVSFNSLNTTVNIFNYCTVLLNPKL